MVAQRTLTPYVRVRILLPLPNEKPCNHNGYRVFFMLILRVLTYPVYTHFGKFERDNNVPNFMPKQLAPRPGTVDTVRAEFRLRSESEQHPIGPAAEVPPYTVLHGYIYWNEVVISCPVPNRCRLQ